MHIISQSLKNRNMLYSCKVTIYSRHHRRFHCPSIAFIRAHDRHSNERTFASNVKHLVAVLKYCLFVFDIIIATRPLHKRQ